MSASSQCWPNGARVAVATTIMFETYMPGVAPKYSVQTTPLKPGTIDHAGIAWSSFGGRTGIWRIINTLDRLQVPATFFANSRCVEEFPEAMAQIHRSGHDVGGHAYTQDGLMTYMSVEGQREVIGRSLDQLESVAGKRPTGWLSPVLAFTPETPGLLAEAGLEWHADVTYTDVPYMQQTEHGPIAALMASDFTDNRVLRASPRDFIDVYKGTFDYLYEHEPGSLLVISMHAHFGGRAMMTAAYNEIITYMKTFQNVWFARHAELGRWAKEQGAGERAYNRGALSGAPSR
jgi:peptidoglycan/xylan/chitin deacetylase (PgdA/CDA1 family)